MDEMQSAPVLKPEKKHTKLLLPIVLGLVIALLLGGLGYLWWQADALRKEKTAAETSKDELQAKVNELTAKLAEATKSTEKEGTPPTCDGTISDELQANIRDAIASGNTAALEGRMTNPISVVLAASDGIGPRTPAQAVADLAYLESGTDPWDFNLPAATLDAYRTNYGTYIGASALAGRSANKLVVVFTFDDCAKIKTILMSASEDILL